MLKTKVFEFDLDTGAEEEINNWLKENQNIAVVSTNSFATDGWIYIILYLETNL
jgi:hypothetical protein